MTFDDPSVVVMGKEPIWHDGRVVSYVTSAAYGYSIGQGIVYGYLPTALAAHGTAVEVEYFGRRHCGDRDRRSTVRSQERTAQDLTRRAERA